MCATAAICTHCQRVSPDIPRIPFSADPCNAILFTLLPFKFFWEQKDTEIVYCARQQSCTDRADMFIGIIRTYERAPGTEVVETNQFAECLQNLFKVPSICQMSSTWFLNQVLFRRESHILNLSLWCSTCLIFNIGQDGEDAISSD